MPTIKGFNLKKDEEGNTTMTDGEGNPLDIIPIAPIRSATPEEKVEEKPEGIDELLKKTRKELDAIAEEKGLDPDDYHNKKEVAKAILEKPEGEEPEGKTPEGEELGEKEKPEEPEEPKEKPEEKLE